MQPAPWHPPVELSGPEEHIVKRIRKAKLFVFLRLHRHELFDEAFQQELASLYRASARGQPPVAPALLALATLLQAYTGASDDEVIEATLMDRRWQLVLGCIDTQDAPFSKGTLVAFRRRLIEGQMDRRLIERTIEIANQRQTFGPRALRAALDSSPLWGAGRVEDTYNLLGHALRKALCVIANQQGRGLADLAREARVEVLAGSSLKAALDLDWDDPAQCGQALVTILDALEHVERWVGTSPPGSEHPQVSASLAAAQQVRRQDVEVTAEGTPALRRKVAKERRIAIEDHEMRHGRKSKHQRIDGYKRHVLHDLST